MTVPSEEELLVIRSEALPPCGVRLALLPCVGVLFKLCLGALFESEGDALSAVTGRVSLGFDPSWQFSVWLWEVLA